MRILLGKYRNAANSCTAVYNSSFSQPGKVHVEMLIHQAEWFTRFHQSNFFHSFNNFQRILQEKENKLCNRRLRWKASVKRETRKKASLNQQVVTVHQLWRSSTKNKEISRLAGCAYCSGFVLTRILPHACVSYGSHSWTNGSNPWEDSIEIKTRNQVAISELEWRVQRCDVGRSAVAQRKILPNVVTTLCDDGRVSYHAILRGLFRQMCASGNKIPYIKSPLRARARPCLHLRSYASSATAPGDDVGIRDQWRHKYRLFFLFQPPIRTARFLCLPFSCATFLQGRST